MQKIKDFIKSKAVLVCTIFIAGLATMFTAHAVHDNLFIEMDGNAEDDGDPRTDWNTLFNTMPLGYSFVDDNNAGPAGNEDVSVYHTGNKDTLLLAAGACTAKTNVNPNLDYEHGYASTFDSVNTQIAFGANRRAENGDKALGVWFMQEEASCDPYDPVNPGIWQGDRTPGDIFLVAEFTRGGDIGSIVGYTWDPTVKDNLRMIFEADEADCQAGLAHHAESEEACLTTNGARGDDPNIYTTTTAWDGDKDPGAFIEGIVDMTLIFGQGNEPCFSTVLMEGRSSTSVKANLHEYILVPIETCGKVILEKETDPAGSSQLFTFKFDEDGQIGGDEDIVGSIGDTEQIHIDDVFPGSYDAEEIVPDGWSLKSTECKDMYDEFATPPTGVVDDTTGPDNINVSRAETVWCKFVNEQMGKIKLIKTTEGGNAKFDFSHTITGLAGSLTTSNGMAMDTSDYLVPGTYTIDEVVPAGWDLTNINCVDSDAGGVASTDNVPPTKAPGATGYCYH